MNVRLIVKGEPKAQKRHRSGYRNGKSYTYDPSSTDKADFLVLMHNSAPKSPLQGPIGLTCEFYCTRPKAHFRTGKHSTQLKPSAPLWCQTRPDIDNYLKFILDAGNTVLFDDDSQIVKVQMSKTYSFTPRVEIYLTELREND
tara:strand:- start:20 stop:448 length:429 start_codon:yes stop_codon:yes gene_type:complete